MTAVTYVRVCVLVLAVRPLPCRVGCVSIVLEGYPPPAGIRAWSSSPLRVASCSFRRAHRAHASCESMRCSCRSLRVPVTLPLSPALLLCAICMPSFVTLTVDDGRGRAVCQLTKPKIARSLIVRTSRPSIYCMWQAMVPWNHKSMGEWN